MNDINWKNLEFRVAKTMPENPHWYVVRSPENEADYVALWQANHERGNMKSGRGAGTNAGDQATDLSTGTWAA